MKTKNKRNISKLKSRIPARERWLFDNKSALRQIKRGLKDAAEGKLIDRGCFIQYLDEDE